MGVRNTVLANDDLGIDTGRVDVAEHVRDATDRAARRRRPACQLDADHLARRRAAFLPGWHENVHQDASIERHHEPHAVAVAVVASHEPAVAALQNADDAPLDAAALFDALDARDDAIAVHCFAEMWRGDVDIAGAVQWTFRNHEAITRGVGLERPDV